MSNENFNQAMDDYMASGSNQELNQEARTIVIKRYSNRKLYDTNSSKYVTLNSIHSLIKEGNDIMVIDNRTKENITSLTLLQVFYEAQKKKLDSNELDAPTMESLLEAIRVM